jgi:transposase
MSQVIIGMDPHKRSATIEVMTSDETVLGGGRYDTGPSGYRAMRRAVRRWPERTWAIEGCQGIGRHLANRLLADGEDVVDVPPKLSARTRVFATGQGRKTDATDAHSVALAATRMTEPVTPWRATARACRYSASGRSSGSTWPSPVN